MEQKKTFSQAERDAIRDGIITEREVQEMLEAYDFENYTRDSLMRERLKSYGYNINIDPRYQINVVKEDDLVDYSDFKFPEIPDYRSSIPFHIRYQKQIFLAILVPTLVICVIGLL